jgi:hypothetical protein
MSTTEELFRSDFYPQKLIVEDTVAVLSPLGSNIDQCKVIFSSSYPEQNY